MRKIENNVSKKKNYQFSGNNSDTEGMLDVDRVLHPLTYYIDDREEMIEEAFSMVSNEKLRKMLPPYIKDIPIDELKASCLIHLLGMSRKRVITILEGGEQYSSSDVDSESDAEDITVKENIQKPKQNVLTKSAKISSESSSANNTESDVEKEKKEEKRKVEKKKEEKKKEKKKKKTSDKPVSKSTTKGKTKIKSKVIPKEVAPVIKKLKSRDNNNEDDDDKGEDGKRNEKMDAKNKRIDPSAASTKMKKRKKHSSSSKHLTKNKKKKRKKKIDVPSEEEESDSKNLLEILELEMRAEAIRTLLQMDSKDSTGGVLEDRTSSSTEVSGRDSQESKLNGSKQSSKYNGNSKEKLESDTSSSSDGISNEESDYLKSEMSENVSDSLINQDHKGSNSQKRKATNTNARKSVEKKVKVDTEKKVKVDTKNSNADDQSNKSYKNNSEPTGDTKLVAKDWAHRWLESKGVQQVVTTSKMCANIRKRMKLARLSRQKQMGGQEKWTPDDSTPSTQMEGSVGEYHMLNIIEQNQTDSNKSIPDNDHFTSDNDGKKMGSEIK